MGRPRKYSNEESRKAARREHNQESKRRVKERLRAPRDSLQIILYHPIQDDVPGETSSATHLRTSLDIPPSPLPPPPSVEGPEAISSVIISSTHVGSSGPLPVPAPLPSVVRSDEEESQVRERAVALQAFDNLDETTREREAQILAQIQSTEDQEDKSSGLAPPAPATTTATTLPFIDMKGKGKAREEDEALSVEESSLLSQYLQDDIQNQIEESSYYIASSPRETLSNDYTQIYHGDDEEVIADIQSQLLSMRTETTPAAAAAATTPALLPARASPSASVSAHKSLSPRASTSSSLVLLASNRGFPVTSKFTSKGPKAKTSKFSQLNPQGSSSKQSQFLRGWLSTQAERTIPVRKSNAPRPSPVSASSQSISLSPLPFPLPTPLPPPLPRQDFSPWGPIEQPGEVAPPFAIRLIRHLKGFQGCSSHTTQENYSLRETYSLGDITSLIEGQSPLTLSTYKVPNILGQHDRLLRKGEFDFNALDKHAMFEGCPDTRATAAATTAAAAPTPATPWELSLDTFHAKTKHEKQSRTSFDIDSICCFPTSLAVAKQGLLLIPQQYSTLSLSSNVHLGIQVQKRNSQGHISSSWQPLHSIRHFCIGQLIGMPLFLLCFFPSYDLECEIESRSGKGKGKGSGSGNDGCHTLLRREDEITFIDEILLPVLYQSIQDPNIIQHLPRSAATIKANAKASGSERYIKVPRSQEQIITYHLQADVLDTIWEKILEQIATATATATGQRFRRFSNPTLFLNGKNLKIDFMDASLQKMTQRFRQQWDRTIDSTFLPRHMTYFDLGKQVTSEDSKLPSMIDAAAAAAAAVASERAPSTSPLAGVQAETYLWRKCCLDSLYSQWNSSSDSLDPQSPGDHSQPSRDRTPSSTTHLTPLPFSVTPAAAPAPAPAPATDSRPTPAKAFSRVYYPWATLRDAGSQTFSTTPRGAAFKQGYIYGQFYNLIKQPFDSTKVYCFDNINLENLALDPAYIRTLHKEGGAQSFSTATATASYLHSKKRATVNIRDSQDISFGIREEHRISLELFDDLLSIWITWDSASSVPDTADALQLSSAPSSLPSTPTPLPLPLPAPLPLPTPVLPYYVFTTAEILAFIRTQMNKYCLLFEYILSQTSKTHSLPEFLMMVLALRSLRFCYSSSLLSREYLLYKDLWEVLRENKSVYLGGIGMGVAVAKYGIGWYLPKIDWTFWRLKSTYYNHFLAGNILLHAQYQRRWRAVRDLRDVYIRLNQAEQWFTKYKLHSRPGSGTGSGHLLTFEIDQSNSTSNQDSKQRLSRKRDIWIDYLHGLVLNQFDSDIIAALRRYDSKKPELYHIAADRHGSGSDSDSGSGRGRGRGNGKNDGLEERQFCYDSLRYSFIGPDLRGNPPHVSTGNKAQFKTSRELINFLFDSNDQIKRDAWGTMTYRLIYELTHTMIRRLLGKKWQRQWQEEFKILIHLTHWILPHANTQSFLNPTKTNQGEDKIGQTTWFSCYYQEAPSFRQHIKGWPADRPRTMQSIIRTAAKSLLFPPLPLPEPAPLPAPAPPPIKNTWRISDLLRSCRKLGLDTSTLTVFSIRGRTQDGTTIIPLWERGLPPKLQICSQISHQTLEELETLFQDMIKEIE